MNEVLEKEKTPQDHEEKIRPITLEEYTGQEKIKKNLKIFIESAKIRGDVLDHSLFYGPPGLGKTTLAGVIANEMGSDLISTTGPMLEKPIDIASTLLSIKEGDVLFIDEIHRLSKSVEEVLYLAMEDRALDVIVGKEETSKTVRIDLPKFTVIGATTKLGLISAPLRDRFGLTSRLELYAPAEIEKIVKRDAKILGIEIENEAIQQIGKRSRGTPRIAIRLLKRLRDFAVVKNPKSPVIDEATAKNGLLALGVDEMGFDETDAKVLCAIHSTFGNGPVGLETLSLFVGEDMTTIEDVCEPFLIHEGYIAKTPRGRTLTKNGIEYAEKILKK